MPDETVIPPDRPLVAVDCEPADLAEMGPVHTGGIPSSLLGTIAQPRALCDLTREKVIAAERFLLLCGRLTVPSASASDTMTSVAGRSPHEPKGDVTHDSLTGFHPALLFSNCSGLW